MLFWKKKSNKKESASTNYRVITDQNACKKESSGWNDSDVVIKQNDAYRDLIQQLRSGKGRIDLEVAANALLDTKLKNPSVLEVGCGSGYYSEILSFILKQELNYTGIDFSIPMIKLATSQYPNQRFAAADATKLPFADGTFDVVLNGNSLMHTVDYEAAISESSRVARSWCIFHTVPVLQNRSTTMLQKNAYGGPVLEVIFQERELFQLLAKHHLEVNSWRDSIVYDLQSILNERTVTKTYLCRRL